LSGCDTLNLNEFREKRVQGINLLGRSKAHTTYAVGANWGETMQSITTLAPMERVRLDPDRLEVLYTRLGEDGADNVLCRAMEEMAIRLKQSEKLYGAGASGELRKTVHSLISISDQIGLDTLADVARDVVTCIDSGDWTALGATFARLIRTSDQSLTAIWDLHDVTI
jgi:hypothetical protein